MPGDIEGEGGGLCPDLPVRMFWKANSTLLASRAEVSMKERLFSPTMKVLLAGFQELCG